MKKIKLAICACLLIAALPLSSVTIISFMVSADQLESGEVQFTPPCKNKLAGKPCMTCGMTRSFCSISHFEFKRAYDYNPKTYIVYFAVMIIQIFLYYSLWQVRKMS